MEKRTRVRTGTGCGECRRKKAKCDERRPFCSRCAKYPRSCSYELRVQQVEIKTAKDRPSPNSQTDKGFSSKTVSQKSPRDPMIAVTTFNERSSLPIHDPSLVACSLLHNSITSSSSDIAGSRYAELAVYRPKSFPDIHSRSHRFYLHHFIRQTAAIYFPLEPEVFLRLIIPVAEKQRCMLGAILAASSSHYFRLNNYHQAYVSAIEATVQTLSSLRKALTASVTGSEMLATTLMLATTCLCAGDTSTYRQHLDGALRIVERAIAPHQPDALCCMSMRWLAQLLLMDRVSNLHQTGWQQLKAATWQKLLEFMPASGQVDKTTGFSAELINTLRDICDISDEETRLSRPKSNVHDELDVGESKGLSAFDKSHHAQLLEDLLLNLRDNATYFLFTETPPPTDSECSHNLFVNATLLFLYKRVWGFQRDHPAVTATVNIMVLWLQRIDADSCVNAPLLWPLLAAGCEATTEQQRIFFAERMSSMMSHGLGNCRIVFQFLHRYWQKGNDMRWDHYAKYIREDLILF